MLDGGGASDVRLAYDYNVGWSSHLDTRFAVGGAGGGGGAIYLTSFC